jgi:hypothetical protein
LNSTELPKALGAVTLRAEVPAAPTHRLAIEMEIPSTRPYDQVAPLLATKVDGK